MDSNAIDGKRQTAPAPPSGTAAGYPKRPSRPPRAKVLVVAHPDGFLEVYGDNIDVHIVTPLSMYTAAGEVLADEYLDATLPWRFRDLHVMPKLRAMHQVKVVRPSDEVGRVLRLGLVHAAAAVRGEQQEEIACRI